VFFFLSIPTISFATTPYFPPTLPVESPIRLLTLAPKFLSRILQHNQGPEPPGRLFQGGLGPVGIKPF
jgi:hypothetical protein